MGGIIGILKFLTKFGYRELLRSVFYWRFIEYPKAFDWLKIKKSDKLLDIGSNESVFPLFVLYNTNCTVYTTDINDYSKFYYEKLENLKMDSNRFFFKKEDARKLDFPSNSFDKILVISSIEHISKNGDILALKEIKRVLKKNGLVFLSVPFYKKYRKVDKYFKTANEKTFYEHQYDHKAINERLIKPSGLKLQHKEYFGERLFRFQNLWVKVPENLRKFVMWLSPLFAKLFLKSIDESKAEKIRFACFLLSKE